MKFLYSLIMSLASISLAIGQSDSTFSNGDWDDNSIWKDGNFPGVFSGGVVYVQEPDTVIYINKTVNVPGDLVLRKNTNIQPPRIIIGPGGRLNIGGDLIFADQSTPRITVKGTSLSKAILNVEGDFAFTSNNNDSEINFEHAVVYVGNDFKLLGGSNLKLNFSEDVILSVNGNFAASQSQILNFDETSAILVDSVTTISSGLSGVLNGKLMLGGGMTGTLAGVNIDVSDVIEIFSDSTLDLQNDSRTGMSTNSINGGILDFAEQYPVFCSYSALCRSVCATSTIASVKAICGGASPLPVTWAEVSVQESLGLVTVYWSTYSESDNDYFEVYKSNDAENWTSVGVVAGAGYSKELLSYALIDTESPTEITYYRVAQVDYDGASEFSKTVVYIPGTGLASSEGLYPNPNEGSFYLDLGEDELLSVSITNSKGESVSFNYTLLDNLIKVEIDGSYSSGFYTVTMVTNNGVAQKNFVIK